MSPFLKGFLSVFGYKTEPPQIKSDEEALAEDWEAVGKDMRKAIEQFQKEELP